MDSRTLHDILYTRPASLQTIYPTRLCPVCRPRVHASKSPSQRIMSRTVANAVVDILRLARILFSGLWTLCASAAHMGTRRPLRRRRLVRTSHLAFLPILVHTTTTPGDNRTRSEREQTRHRAFPQSLLPPILQPHLGPLPRLRPRPSNRSPHSHRSTTARAPEVLPGSVQTSSGVRARARSGRRARAGVSSDCDSGYAVGGVCLGIYVDSFGCGCSWTGVSLSFILYFLILCLDVILIHYGLLVRIFAPYGFP
jgi:hypothetical protein